ncbi:hypothetical protein BKK49_04560 [Rodentibacter rarus]|uniref:hypothetical protein n=1 Tax=Rodentibacter rarus TaxID=1908260 RepID=UPI0009873BB3|nr:hypothetical protein [Rodentibacter rarus]OOF41693.1 hypothetical protein BKK49_04560 [Rodentibacter rarus]
MSNIEYEWLLIDDFDGEEPTKEEIDKTIEEKLWDTFNRESRPFYLESSVAEELFKRHYSDWECYDEDECVFLVIREKGGERYALFRVSPYYKLSPDVDKIYFDD